MTRIFKIKNNDRLNEFFPKGHSERTLIENGQVEYYPVTSDASIFSHIGDRYFLFRTKKHWDGFTETIWLECWDFVK